MLGTDGNAEGRVYLWELSKPAAMHGFPGAK